MNDLKPGFPFYPPVIGEYINNPTGYKYKIIKPLKSGTFGTVFSGVDIFENPYAIKVFHPIDSYDAVRDMWTKEAEILRKLPHPNIAYMHDMFEYNMAFYIVLELLGDPLSKYVMGVPVLKDSQILEVARHLLYGLSFIHWHNIIHRDLSIENILYSRDNTIVKITDFGVSKEFQPFILEKELFNRRIVCPDLLRYGFSTPQSDLYHVGLILLALKLGKESIPSNLPFEKIQEQVENGIPRTLAESLGDPLGNRIAVLLRRRAEYRYTSAINAWDDFRKLLSIKNFD